MESFINLISLANFMLGLRRRKIEERRETLEERTRSLRETLPDTLISGPEATDTPLFELRKSDILELSRRLLPLFKPGMIDRYLRFNGNIWRPDDNNPYILSEIKVAEGNLDDIRMEEGVDLYLFFVNPTNNESTGTHLELRRRPKFGFLRDREDVSLRGVYLSQGALVNPFTSRNEEIYVKRKDR